jgi:hypothetical protein
VRYFGAAARPQGFAAPAEGAPPRRTGQFGGVAAPHHRPDLARSGVAIAEAPTVGMTLAVSASRCRQGRSDPVCAEIREALLEELSLEPGQQRS